MDMKTKMSVARVALKELSKSANDRYGENGHTYMAGYLESMMVNVLADLSDEAYDDQMAMLMSANDSLKSGGLGLTG